MITIFVEYENIQKWKTKKMQVHTSKAYQAEDKTWKTKSMYQQWCNSYIKMIYLTICYLIYCERNVVKSVKMIDI